MHYQVQEMLRAEHITKEEAIEHEVITYNELVPEKHQLTATLLVEFEDPVIRAVKLKELVPRKSLYRQLEMTSKC